MHKLALLASVVAGFAAVTASFAQTSSVITVNDPRPLAQAALQLEGLIGVAINYEDVPYAYAGDMQNVTSSVMSPEQQAAHPGAEIWVPRGGQISVDLSQVPGFAQQSAIASASVASGTPLIAALIAAQASQNLPGVYTSTSSNGAFYITPAQARNASIGEMIRCGWDCAFQTSSASASRSPCRVQAHPVRRGSPRTFRLGCRPTWAKAKVRSRQLS